jgi:hypothetical protein
MKNFRDKAQQNALFRTSRELGIPQELVFQIMKAYFSRFSVVLASYQYKLRLPFVGIFSVYKRKEVTREGVKENDE